MEIIGMPGMEEMTNQLQNMLNSLGSNKKNKRKVTVKKAFELLQEEETAKFINEEEIKKLAIKSVEQNGIVFIDEIDKICKNSDNKNNDISREGVQRDLLPLIEGATISTKYGMVKTDHILFIASGAFHISSPSDLIPELQGRLPIRVTLMTLTIKDFIRILTEPDFSILKQYVVLLKTESIIIKFTQKAIIKIAETAYFINENIENIGARRLHTVCEKLLEDLSFQVNTKKKIKLKITQNYVESKLSVLVSQKNIKQYII